MEIKDIIVPADFLNLTKNDIDKILAEIDIEIEEDIDSRSYLFDKKNELFMSNEISTMVETKVLAGRTSVKWYRFDVSIDDIDTIKSRIESDRNHYNSINLRDTSQIDGPDIYSCIKIDEEAYLMRVLVPSGSKTINDGYSLRRMRSIRNAVLIIDLKNNYIEVRTNSRDAKRVVNSICKPLIGQEIVEINILSRYNGSIENFKNDLDNGKFIDVTSSPDLNIVLTREQNELLVNVLEALDEYFIDKDIEKLKSELLDVDLGTEEIPFTQLFLAGLSEIGMATRMDVQDDLSSQSLYGVLKSHMTNQKGFIRFTLATPESAEFEHTIQLGIGTNSISFRSSSNEQVIEYIRKKVLGY